jgi:two-component system, LytTR family, response regulator
VLSRDRVMSVVQERVAVRDDGRTRFLRLSDVDWLESEGNYVRFHVGGKSHLVRGTISGFERRLDPKRFVRIHRGFLVNMDRVVEVQPWFGGDWVVKLTDGKTLRLSRTYRDAFHTKLTGVPPEEPEDS